MTKLPPSSFVYQVSRLDDKKRPVVMLVVFSTILVCALVASMAAWTIWTSREQRFNETSVSTSNVVRMIAGQVEGAMKTADLALVNIVERAEHDGLADTEIARLDRHLLILAQTSPELHGLFVYDEHGAWLATSLDHAVKGNNSDRDYFKYHRNHAGHALHVGAPIKSRSTGQWIIPVSRRIDKPDGTFAGVALVTLRINFFEKTYDDLNIGKTGTIILALSNGTLIYRRPFEERQIGIQIPNGPVMQAAKVEGSSGTALLVSKIDRVERLYSYRHLRTYPFVVAVGETKAEFLSNWKRASIVLGAAVVIVIMMLSYLARKLIRQILIRDKLDGKLRAISLDLERHNVGLTLLAQTDKLTQLANRRLFDEFFSEELKRAQRLGAPLCLILMDVDLFKKFNDHYGHVAGDRCLQAVATVLAEQVVRAGDLAARYGGEEFAVVLPNTDQAGGMAVAERIRSGILGLAMPHALAPLGLVSASFGVVSLIPSGQDKSGDIAGTVLGYADAQLYAAKEAGRNCILGIDMQTEATA